MPEQGKPAARAKGQERYERFIETLERVASGTRVGDELAIDFHVSPLSANKDAADQRLRYPIRARSSYPGIS